MAAKNTHRLQLAMRPQTVRTGLFSWEVLRLPTEVREVSRVVRKELSDLLICEWFDTSGRLNSRTVHMKDVLFYRLDELEPKHGTD